MPTGARLAHALPQLLRAFAVESSTDIVYVLRSVATRALRCALVTSQPHDSDGIRTFAIAIALKLKLRSSVAQRRCVGEDGAVLVPRSPAPQGSSCLAPLSLDEKATLCRLLLIESGLTYSHQQSRAEHIDLHFFARPLWRRRRIRVRVFERQVREDDLAELEALRVADRLADVIAIETADCDLTLSDVPDGMQLVRADEFILRLRASAVVSWTGGTPAPEASRFEQWADLAQTAAAHDPIGLRWLPTLAFNKIPADLSDVGKTADQLLERIAFRVLTTVFRFGGERLGETRRGERLPDAILFIPASGSAALLDCKAAGEGYTMSTADERAQVEYATKFRALAERVGRDVTHTVILSSQFGGDFELRRNALRDQADIGLVYLRAVDLVRLALDVEIAEEPPRIREAIPWAAIFDVGQPDSGDMANALEQARQSENPLGDTA
jgi:hypothetical protein